MGHSTFRIYKNKTNRNRTMPQGPPFGAVGIMKNIYTFGKKNEAEQLLDLVINSFGNPSFNSETVIGVLKEAADKMQESGENPGSLWAAINCLGNIEELAKKIY